MNARIISTFLVMVGFGISFSVNAQFVQEKKISDSGSNVDYQEMQIQITDASNGDEVISDVRVKGLNPRKTVVFESIADTVFEIKNYRLYTVSCIEEGYMYYTEKFWPAEEVVHLQQVKLHPLRSGLKTDIRDISFLGNKTEIYHKSRSALDELTEWLKLNPKVKVAVIGHVNGPDQTRSKKFYRKVSEERAQAVIDYVISKGISADRLEARGAGNSQMIYPDPKTDWQNEANRRIEIEVTGM